VKAPGAIAALFLIPRTLGATAGLAIVAALAIPLEFGVRAHLAPQGHYAPQFSLQYVSLPLAVFAIAALLIAALRYLRVTPTRGVALLIVAAWLAIPNPYPWYAVWVLPVAFLAWDTPAAWALISLSLLTVLRYYGDATTAHLSRPLSTAIVAAQVLLPLVLLSVQHIRSLRYPSRPESHMPAPDFATSRTP
jgi:hypothetical protein